MSKIKVFFPPFTDGKGLLMEIAAWTETGELKLSDLAMADFEQVSQPEDSDWIMVPIFLSGLIYSKNQSYLKNAHDLAQKLCKPFGLCSNSDLIIDPSVSEYYLFTPGTYKSYTNMVELPATLPFDPISSYYGGDIAPIQRVDKASIGFCGQATSNIFKTTKDFLMILQLRLKKKLGHSPFLKIPFFLSSLERFRLLSKLEKSDKLVTDFIYRSKYRGGAISMEERNKIEIEFFQNIRENLFTICMRGMGNYSVRFYQTLAMGRIPVWIDTDGRIPFFPFMEEKDFFLPVPFSDRFRIDELVDNYLKSKSEEELVAQQVTCRKIWVTYYQKEVFLQFLKKEMLKIQRKRTIRS